MDVGRIVSQVPLASDLPAHPQNLGRIHARERADVAPRVGLPTISRRTRRQLRLHHRSDRLDCRTRADMPLVGGWHDTCRPQIPA